MILNSLSYCIFFCVNDYKNCISCVLLNFFVFFDKIFFWNFLYSFLFLFLVLLKDYKVLVNLRFLRLFILSFFFRIFCLIKIKNCDLFKLRVVKLFKSW